MAKDRTSPAKAREAESKTILHEWAEDLKGTPFGATRRGAFLAGCCYVGFCLVLLAIWGTTC